MDLAAPRAPHAAAGAPLYESHYLTAVAPGGGRALWLRYTADKAPGSAATSRLWCTYFDADAPQPHARRTKAPHEVVVPPDGTWASIGDAAIAPGDAHGALEDCSWGVTWQPEAPPLPYLPSERLYDRPIPRAGGIALAPAATFAGTAEIAGAAVDLTGWRGMVGHNWGADHAERWLWLHATGLGDRDPDGWVDLVIVRVRIGPVLTPWLPAGAVHLDGEVHRVGAAAARGLRVDVGDEDLTLRIPRVGLTLETRSPGSRTVRWDYVSPSGHTRDVRNCSIADARLRVGDTEATIDAAFQVEVGA